MLSGIPACSWEDDVPENEIKIAIANEKGQRTFYIMNPEYLYYLICTETLCAHEIYKGKCKLALDVERESDEANDFERCLQKIIREILKKSNTKEYRILDCHRQGKRSSHVIFPDIWFHDPKDIPNWLKFNITTLTKDVDMGIYSHSLRFPLCVTRDKKHRMTPRIPIENIHDFYMHCCTLTEALPPLTNFISGQQYIETKRTVCYSDDLMEHMRHLLRTTLEKDRRCFTLIENTCAARVLYYPCLYHDGPHKSNEMRIFADWCSIQGTIILRCRCLDPECINKKTFLYY